MSHHFCERFPENENDTYSIGVEVGIGIENVPILKSCIAARRNALRPPDQPPAVGRESESCNPDSDPDSDPDPN